MPTPDVSVREWTDVVRRARLGKTTKYIAFVVASYADFADGSRVFPGVATLAHAAEVNYKTVQKGVSELLAAGLIEVVRAHSGTRERGTEYRLALGEQLLDRVRVESPAEFRLAAERLGAARRRGRSTAHGEGRTQPQVQPTGRAVLAEIEPEVQPTGRGELGEVQPTPRPQYNPPGGRIPTQDQDTTTTRHSDSDLRTAVTAPGARDREQDQISTSSPGPPALPERCAHGLKARTRADGSSSCALCRKGAPPAAPKRRGNVVQLPRTA